MTELGAVVQSLAAREGVDGVLLLSGDGLPIQHAARGELDAEAVAALAATLAALAIFLPVVFMKGVIGKFFFQFGVTLSIAVMLSYVEAITLAPARCAQMLENQGHAGQRSFLGRAVDRGFDALRRGYARTLAIPPNTDRAAMFAELERRARERHRGLWSVC